MGRTRRGATEGKVVELDVMLARERSDEAALPVRVLCHIEMVSSH